MQGDWETSGKQDNKDCIHVIQSLFRLICFANASAPFALLTFYCHKNSRNLSKNKFLLFFSLFM